MHVSFIQDTSISKSANGLEYWGKRLKYLCIAFDRPETKCWWLTLNIIENLIINSVSISILKNIETELANFNNRSINEKSCIW